MNIKMTKNLKNEILLTLNNGSFEVTAESKLCEIFEVSVRFLEIFKSSKIIEMDRDCKVELLKWINQRHIETDNSKFATKVKHPTFLDIMKAASRSDED